MNENKETGVSNIKYYSEEFLKNIRNLQQNDELCDFTVTAEGKSIRVIVYTYLL